MNKLTLFVFLSIVVTSCQWTAKKLPDENRLLKEEIDKIDWTKVDSYPSVEQCDSLFDETERKKCFFEFITQNLQEELSLDTLIGRFEQLDTLKVLVTVQTDSRIQLELYDFPDSLKAQTMSIDSLLKVKERNFPVVQPAIKRGLPVKSQFLVPLILNRQSP
jgi:hypothetical protein